MARKVEEVLKELIRNRGMSVCSEPKRLQAMLRDLTTEHKGKIKALVSVVEENIAEELFWQTGREIDHHVYHRVVMKLHQDAAIDQNMSEWAVDCWINALDKQAPKKLKTTSVNGDIQSTKGSVPSRSFIPQSQTMANIRRAQTVQSISPYGPVKHQGYRLNQNLQVQASVSGGQSSSRTGGYQGVSTLMGQTRSAKRTRKTFSFVQIAIGVFILAGAYKLVTSPIIEEPPFNKQTAAEQQETNMDGRDVPYKSRKSTTELVDSSEIEHFMISFYDKFVEALNGQGFTYIEDYYDPTGSEYESVKTYLESALKAGMETNNLFVEVESVIPKNHNHYIATVYLENEYYYPNGTGNLKKIRANYLIKVTNEKKLLIKEIPKITVLEKRDF